MLSWFGRTPLRELANAAFSRPPLSSSSSSSAASPVTGPYYADDSCCEESHSDHSDVSDDGDSSASDMPSSPSSVGEDTDDDEEYKDDGVEEMDDGWTDELREVTPHAFRPVTLSPVAAAALAACESPLDYFYLIIPPSFITHMVEQTNLYAEQRAEQAKENRSRLRSRAGQRRSAHNAWQAVTEAEMLAFLGCLCYMSDVTIANVRDYWERTYYQPFVADRFPRDRQPLADVRGVDGQESRAVHGHLLRPLH
jgi:hypothetical protein